MTEMYIQIAPGARPSRAQQPPDGEIAANRRQPPAASPLLRPGTAALHSLKTCSNNVMKKFIGIIVLAASCTLLHAANVTCIIPAPAAATTNEGIFVVFPNCV